MTFLLDVNLLLALAWPSHVHHKSAHAWFRQEGSRTWSTCPLTQLGFVRLSSNTAFTADAVSPAEALSLLQKITSIGGHEFWHDDINCVESTFLADILLAGHRQVTDAYLIKLARAHSGCLATLDRRMIWILPKDERPNPHLRIVGTA